MTVQRTVLHVDDDPEFLELSEQLFKRGATFQTLSAPTAEDGLRMLETNEIDCVISDFVVSTEGTPFISAARDANVDIPIILFTGKEWDLVAKDATAADISEYVQKAGVDEIELVKNHAQELVGGRNGTTSRTVVEPVEQLGEAWEVIGTHDWSGHEELGTSVLRVMEEALDEGPHPDVPLFKAIDADALSELLAPTPSGYERPGVQVRFPYKGYELAVTSEGDIAIRTVF